MVDEDHEFFAGGLLVHNCVIGALAVITDESKAIAQQAMRIATDPARRAAYAQLASNRSRVTARDANGNPLATLPPHMRRSVRAMFPGQ